ncbi:hypothetical protein F4W66_06755 [Escherichia coli]|nr:hypothetical protein F4W66_06755 [Escherichia coli]
MFLIYITLFIQRVYFISPEKKTNYSLMQMFQLLSAGKYLHNPQQMFLMMDMPRAGDALSLINKNIRYAKG